MEVESKVPVNESGDKKEEMTSADYYFDRYVQGSTDRQSVHKEIPWNVQVSIIFRESSKFFLKIGVSKFFLDKNLILSRGAKSELTSSRFIKPKRLEKG